MKVFLSLFFLLLSTHTERNFTEYANDHLVLSYPSDWVVRPISNTAKENLILENEKLSVWSPLKPDEDRKTIKLTVPSSIHYNRSISLKKLLKEIQKSAKAKLQDFEILSSEEGQKEQIPYLKSVFSNKIGLGFEVTELYIFNIQETPYSLYLTSSRKEYNQQRKTWDEIWSGLSFQ